MKILIAIVQNQDAGKVTHALNNEGFTVTKLASTGGFLRAGNTTLLMGVEDKKVEEVLKIIENQSKSRKKVITADTTMVSGSIMTPTATEVNVGGATVFLMDVEDYRKF